MRKLLYIWILLPLCIACERDLMSYEGEEAIYFAVQSGHSYASEKDWPYMPYTLAEFGKVQEDTMVVNIKVMITGPEKDYPGEPGLQRDNSQDWWPRMVVLKILQQYYSATNDKRVVAFMTKYFRYQLNTLPQKPLGHWSSWAEFRACDNLQAVYWLYNLTGEDFLLELGHLLHRQSFSFIDMVDRGDLRRPCTIHCVNLAQGIKEPIIYYQQDTDRKYIDAVKEGFRDIRRFHGQPQGMYGGDEALHGNNPTQGSELCSAVELMYSLEKMVEITGDIDFADHLERIAFNALPAQISDDFMTKQYFQQPNQVMVTRHRRNFDQDHEGTDLAFGTLTGYPCCFSNMHQGWPKFTQHLWYATPDNGIAAICLFSVGSMWVIMYRWLSVKILTIRWIIR